MPGVAYVSALLVSRCALFMRTHSGTRVNARAFSLQAGTRADAAAPSLICCFSSSNLTLLCVGMMLARLEITVGIHVPARCISPARREVVQ